MGSPTMTRVLVGFGDVIEFHYFMLVIPLAEGERLHSVENATGLSVVVDFDADGWGDGCVGDDLGGVCGVWGLHRGLIED